MAQFDIQFHESNLRIEEQRVEHLKKFKKELEQLTASELDSVRSQAMEGATNARHAVERLSRAACAESLLERIPEWINAQESRVADAKVRLEKTRRYVLAEKEVEREEEARFFANVPTDAEIEESKRVARRERKAKIEQKAASL